MDRIRNHRHSTGFSTAGITQVLANLVEGRMLHSAPTWARRTKRAAKRMLRDPRDLDPQILENAKRVLAAIDARELL
jgi:hypothetical protein